MVLVDDGQDRRSTPYIVFSSPAPECPFPSLSCALVPIVPDTRRPAIPYFPRDHGVCPFALLGASPGLPTAQSLPLNVTATPHARTPRPFPAAQDLRKPGILLLPSSTPLADDCPPDCPLTRQRPWVGSRSAEAILCWALEPGSRFDTDCGCRGPLFIFDWLDWAPGTKEMWLLAKSVGRGCAQKRGKGLHCAREGCSRQAAAGRAAGSGQDRGPVASIRLASAQH